MNNFYWIPAVLIVVAIVIGIISPTRKPDNSTTDAPVETPTITTPPVDLDTSIYKIVRNNTYRRMASLPEIPEYDDSDCGSLLKYVAANVGSATWNGYLQYLVAQEVTDIDDSVNEAVERGLIEVTATGRYILTMKGKEARAQQETEEAIHNAIYGLLYSQGVGPSLERMVSHPYPLTYLWEKPVGWVLIAGEMTEPYRAHRRHILSVSDPDARPVRDPEEFVERSRQDLHHDLYHCVKGGWVDISSDNERVQITEAGKVVAEVYLELARAILTRMR